MYVNFIFQLVSCLPVTCLQEMVGHLQSKFPAMFQLYTPLTNCESLPTPFEVKIASTSKDISKDDINKHLKSLELSTVSSIQAAFDKQTLVSLYQFGILLTNTFIVGGMGPIRI